MSNERLIHGIIGVLIWLAYLKWHKTKCNWNHKVLMLLSVLVGTLVPDLDLIFGIGFHRSPITHSILPVIAISYLTRSISEFVIPVGFGLGVMSHLLWDIIIYGDVRWIPGGHNDRLFLLINSFILLVWIMRKKEGKNHS